MKAQYIGKCEGCKRHSTTIADSPEAVIFWALSGGWMLLYDTLICPECAKDNFNPDGLFGKLNENREEK